MATLLIVLVVVCALAIGVQMARGFWSRARSVHRHQQALETLADITQAASGTAPSEVGEGAQHQAHVRLLGPAGETQPSEAGALPPPKPLPPSVHANQSPFRRPSRTGRSAEPGTPAALAGPGQLHGRPGAKASPVAPAITPPAGPIGEDDIPDEDVTRVIPGLTPPPPPKPDSEPTRPVPVIRPHVFYFDDLSSRTGDGKAGDGKAGAGKAGAGKAGAGKAGAGAGDEGHRGAGANGAVSEEIDDRPNAGRQRRLAAQALVAASVALVVAAGAVYVAVGGRFHLSGQANGPSRATSLPKSHPTAPPTSRAGATTRPRASTTRSSVTTTTTPTSTTPTTTTPTTLPKPVQLLSAVKGTDTYQLHSKTASIVVKATGPCWVEVRVGGPAGQVATEETLQAGQQAKVTGPAWIRLGDPPYASVLVDGTPTTIPGSKYGVPLNLDFTVS